MIYVCIGVPPVTRGCGYRFSLVGFFAYHPCPRCGGELVPEVDIRAHVSVEVE